MRYIHFITLFVFLLSSCQSKKDDLVYQRLQKWDAQITDTPQEIKDSLNTLASSHLTGRNEAYFNLLSTIADDKTYTVFTSDSTINLAEDYFSKHDKSSSEHLRSLIYQGIVRLRMNVMDSTVLIPLREAEKIYRKLEQKDPALGVLLYIYLGYINYEKGTYSSADKYYKQALVYAKKQDNIKYKYDAYAHLYWNEMLEHNTEKGKLYMDTMSTFTDLDIEDRYSLLNIKSIYYNTIKDCEKSLELEKEKLAIFDRFPNHDKKYSIYYTVSTRYLSLNQLDSAMYYGLQSIEHIGDSTYQWNYLLYQNIEDIAVAKKDYATAYTYGRKSFDAYQKSVEYMNDKHIIELEKQYDLTEAENAVLKAQKRNIVYSALFLLSLALTFIGIYFVRRKRLIDELRLEKAEEKAKQLELEKRLVENDVAQREEMLSLFGKFLAEYGQMQNHLHGMGNRIKAKDMTLGEEYEKEMKSGFRNFQRIIEMYFTEEKFLELFPVHDTEHLFSQSERMIISMLSYSIPNEQIAALLNTTSHNFKTRKSYLKKKIVENANSENNFEILLSVF